MNAWLKSGSIKFCEDFEDGIEIAPKAFIAMLKGKNFAKLIVRVSHILCVSHV